MSEPFLAEIRLFPITFVPTGWAPCNGQILAIQQNAALYALIGNSYGGNGTTNFALPNLNGFVAVGTGLAPSGTLYMLGQTAGENAVSLNVYEMPAHTHQLVKKDTDAGSAGKIATPNTNCDLGGLSAADGSVGYQSGNTAIAPDTALDSRTITLVGGSQPHENRQPFLATYYAIAMQGIFPQRS